MMNRQCTSNPQSIKWRGRTLCKLPQMAHSFTCLSYDCHGVTVTKWGSTLASFARLAQRICADEREQTGRCPLQHKNDSVCSPGSPVPEVSWFRDGQVISTSTLPGVQISFSDGRARLMIPAVTKANSGRYSLRATNGSGQATSTAELLVTG